LDDLEGQYCNRNCISCSVSSLATAAGFPYYYILLKTSYIHPASDTKLELFSLNYEY